MTISNGQDQRAHKSDSEFSLAFGPVSYLKQICIINSKRNSKLQRCINVDLLDLLTYSLLVEYIY